MPPPSDSIKGYKTPVDEQGGYRTYTVYPQGKLFIFECWDCSLTNPDGSSVGTRKAYTEFSDLKEALAEYERYLEAWEPKD